MSTTSETPRILKHVADNGGELQRVEELVNEALPNDVLALVLTFANAMLVLVVNAGDDSLFVTTAVPSVGERDALINRRNGAWDAAMHCELVAGWAMINQQGYEDAIQLQFALPNDLTSGARAGSFALPNEAGCVLQLIAVASSIKLYKRD